MHIWAHTDVRLLSFSEEAQDALGKKSLSAVLLDLLSHEIDADEDAGKASLSLNAASALATCLMNCTLHFPILALPLLFNHLGQL
jgi:hypothetical protein